MQGSEISHKHMFYTKSCQIKSLMRLNSSIPIRITKYHKKEVVRYVSGVTKMYFGSPSEVGGHETVH